MSHWRTVYDFSGLSVYPDGSKPTQSSALRPPRAHVDPRGNWVVHDASCVPKFYKPQDVGDDAKEEEQFGFTMDFGTSTSAKGKERERTPEDDAHSRSAKRRKVAHNLDFLETTLPNAGPASSSTFPVPSSDLLKCIHHFACNYYSEHGQLFNSSRTYRKLKKQRRLAKLARQAKAAEDADVDSGEEDPAPELDALKTRKINEDRRRDMYKTMEGSALLAIGMLLQEHVARILSPRIPEGWQESLLEQPEDEDDDEEGQDEEGEDEDEEGEDEEEEEHMREEDDKDDDETEDGTEEEGNMDDGKDPGSDECGSGDQEDEDKDDDEDEPDRLDSVLDED